MAAMLGLRGVNYFQYLCRVRLQSFFDTCLEDRILLSDGLHQGSVKYPIQFFITNLEAFSLFFWELPQPYEKAFFATVQIRHQYVPLRLILTKER